MTGALYDLGAYPGAVLGADGVVVGEVYAIHPQVESALDALEEVREDDEGEYRRRRAEVLLSDGQLLHCLVYEIHPRHVLDQPRIAAGDWIAHLEKRPRRR